MSVAEMTEVQVKHIDVKVGDDWLEGVSGHDAAVGRITEIEEFLRWVVEFGIYEFVPLLDFEGNPMFVRALAIQAIAVGGE